MTPTSRKRAARRSATADRRQLALGFDGTPTEPELPDNVIQLGARVRAAHVDDAAQLYDAGQQWEGTDPARALECYRRCLDLDPEHVEAALDLGWLLHDRGQPSEAAELYRRALELRPEDAIARFNLGVALEDMGDAAAAIAAYERCLAVDPNCRDAHFNVARLLEARGDSAAALRHLQYYRRLT